MRFLIDGYNFLFHAEEERRSLEKQRDTLIERLYLAFEKLQLSGAIIFDGSRRRDEESGRSYDSPLETIFAPKGQSADEYILEELSSVQNKKTIMVVSNDKGLTRHAQTLGAQTRSIQAFLHWLNKRFSTQKSTRRTPKESPHQMVRLRTIFEDRLKDLTD